MSVPDVVVWVLPPLAGAAMGLRMRSTALALLLGLILVITSVVVWASRGTIRTAHAKKVSRARLATASSKSSSRFSSLKF
jgi:hypothetical protein